MGSVGRSSVEPAVRSGIAKQTVDALGAVAFQTLFFDQLLRVITRCTHNQLRTALSDLERCGVVLIRERPMSSTHGPARMTSISLIAGCAGDRGDATARNDAHWQQFAQSYYLTHRCC